MHFPIPFHDYPIIFPCILYAVDNCHCVNQKTFSRRAMKILHKHDRSSMCYKDKNTDKIINTVNFIMLHAYHNL
jgi:hypothetical protein